MLWEEGVRGPDAEAPSQAVEGGKEGGSEVAGGAWVGLTSLSTKLYHNMY